MVQYAFLIQVVFHLNAHSLAQTLDTFEPKLAQSFAATLRLRAPVEKNGSTQIRTPIVRQAWEELCAKVAWMVGGDGMIIPAQPAASVDGRLSSASSSWLDSRVLLCGFWLC
jgi:hypothetical protein